MPRTIDLNADLGEGFPWDQPLLDRVTSASVCCGAHAGDPDTILQTLRWAKERGVVVGAHPGYPDRENFGRKELDWPSLDISVNVARQLIWLGNLAKQVEVDIRFVKPHGALYNRAHFDEDLASSLVYLCFIHRLPIMCLPGGEVERSAGLTERPFLWEGFVDRRYLPDGRLASRSDPDAILHDPAEIRRQVLTLVDRGIETLCIHGDDPRSVNLADLVLATLKDAGIELRSFV